ncbi:hypothetical protein SBOR_4552 [Sclerotinia borealis F-4128]|uniref:RNA binding protein Nrd1 n=1 Tax=Sclerotinia borealis (strain F-4128) TaxID=1432307 RepID=W9CK18_SCLBF|nr:hypothetical protein SBOR_4552 [Sclerotinia borealis F-4128]
MSSAVAELEAGLQAMVHLRPPGVSGTRIQGLTTLCTQNIQQESALVQKLFIHFKKTPGTHKLGTLYVLDSVTRKWTEQAKMTQQTINSSAPDGTYAAGVHKVKELLPALMNDIIQSAPDDQKDKIKKLVDIWEKGQTFPLQMLNGFKEKLNAMNDTTTPPGSPPSNLQATLGSQPNSSNSTSAPPPNTSSILAALANMANSARQNPTPTPVSSAPPVNPYNVTHAQSNPTQPAQAINQSLPFSVAPQPVNAPAISMPAYGQGPSNGISNFASNPNPFPGAAPINPPGNLDPATQQQVALIKALAATGVPAEQIAGILAAMGNQGAPAGLPPPFAPIQNTHTQNNWGVRDDARDRNGFQDSMRSPPGRYRRRSRSPSPQRGWGGRDSPPNARRRDDFDRESPARMRGSDDRGRGGRGRGNDYRQRSPQRRRSNTPPRTNTSGPKWVGHDSSIGKGNIKVLSRTLFVGGVTSSEHELKGLFNQYGDVQTCIVNKEKRHAFVKMVSREHALRAKEAMEKNRSPDSSLRTRWGVGFGPRDCSDYQTGISIIPISKLTDADRKWMLNAEFGGSGGQEIEPGMVVEEPDIEIGQGVSSKAISRRMQTDNGGKNGPKSGREYEEDERPRYRRDREDRRDDHRDEGRKFPANTVPPVMPPFPLGAFPYPLPTLPNGLPMFPPGFTFPGQQTQSSTQPPPPPGHNPS